MRIEYTCSITTCDMPLGPRTGSKPAGSAENAAMRVPPRCWASDGAVKIRAARLAISIAQPNDLDRSNSDNSCCRA
jgi:hypothetical protein